MRANTLRSACQRRGERLRRDRRRRPRGSFRQAGADGQRPRLDGGNMDGVKKDNESRLRVPSFGRRDLVKLGAGAVWTALSAPALLAQRGGGGRRAERPEGFNLATGVGYKNDANRISGNGPMDHTSQVLVSYVNSFSESNLTEPVTTGVNKLMLDCMVALIGSFGSEVGQITSRLAKMYPPGELKSTVAGYGITTVPEAAAFANSFMVRNADYNDGDG